MIEQPVGSSGSATRSLAGSHPGATGFPTDLARQPDTDLTQRPDTGPAQRTDATFPQRPDTGPAQHTDATFPQRPDTGPAQHTDASPILSPDADLTRHLATLRTCVAAITALDPSGIELATATRAHRELGTLCDRVKVFSARLLAKVEEDGRWEAGDSRTFPEWVARGRKTSVVGARQEAMLGRALADSLPGTAQAAAAGEITLEHAQVLARYGPTSEGRRAALASDLPDRNEQYLLSRARHLGVDEFRKVAKRWAASVDEAAHEGEHTASCQKEYLNLSRRPDGLALSGFLNLEHGRVLEKALRAVSGVPAVDDDRLPEQRRAQALGDLARLVLDRGLAGTGSQIRPHLSVHVSWETMQRLAREHPDPFGLDTAGRGDGHDCAGSLGALTPPAELDDGEPIPMSLLQRIACDSEVTRIVFGPKGQVLDVGRSERTFARHLRRAVIARDRHCQFPGCDKPPGLCEVHHRRPWWEGGVTSVENGILMCWYHHDLVHQRQLKISCLATGGWEFRRADGTPLQGSSVSTTGQVNGRSVPGRSVAPLTAGSTGRAEVAGPSDGAGLGVQGELLAG